VANAERIPMSPEVEGLMRGLNALQPAFNAMGEAQRARASADQKEGVQFGKAGGGRDDAQSRGSDFFRGFLEGSGEAAGAQDAEGLLMAEYKSAGDKLDLNINELIGKVYQRQMKGQNDPDFRRGYDRAYAAAASKLRSKHGESVALAVNDEKLATAQTRIDFRVGQFRASGTPLGEGFLDAVNVIADEAKLSGREKDWALFLALRKYSAEGDASVWGVSQLPRKDPRTGQPFPSLYSNPFFKEKIDEEILKAKRAALDNSDRTERRIREDRQRRQDEALLPVLDLYLTGDEKGAEAKLAALSRDRTLFTNVSELVHMRGLIKRGADEITRPGEEEEETQVYLRIHEGRETQRSILENGALGQKAKVRALQYWRNEQSRLRQESSSARQAAAAERSAENSWVRDPLFQADLDFIGKALIREKGLLDKMGPDDEAAKVGAAFARREFIAWVSQNTRASDDERRKKAIEIVEREKRARTATEDGKDPTFTPEMRLKLQGIPYRSREELLANADQHDARTLAAMMAVFDSIQGPKK
jgi:hypothetical protein